MSTTTSTTTNTNAVTNRTRFTNLVAQGWRQTRFEVKGFFRSKEAVVFSFTFPIMLLLLFGSIFGGTVPNTDVSFKQVFVPGILAAGIMSVSFSNLAISIAIERHDGTLKRLAGTPIAPSIYFIGKIGMVFMCAVAESAILLVIGTLFFGLDMPTELGPWLDFTWMMVLGVTACSLIGIAYSRLPRSAKSAPAVVTPPFIFLQFISGVWVYESMLPDGLRALSSIFPLKWIAQGFRSVFLPDSFALQTPAGSWQRPLVFAVLTAWCVGGFVLCKLTFRWRRQE